jgi:hypothetical protein
MPCGFSFCIGIRLINNTRTDSRQIAGGERKTGRFL